VIKTKKKIELIDQSKDRWWKAIFQPIFDSKGTVVKLAYYIQDITKETEAKQNLENSEEKFRVLSDQSLMGIAVIQNDQIIYANEAVSDVCGYSKKELYHGGMQFFVRTIHPDDVNFAIEQLQKKLTGNKKVLARYPIRILSKSGELKWIEIFSKTIHYEGKNADLVTFVDITERKKTEEKLRTIIDNANDGIAIMDDNWQIKYVNPKTLEILGYTKKELPDNM